MRTFKANLSRRKLLRNLGLAAAASPVCGSLLGQAAQATPIHIRRSSAIEERHSLGPQRPADRRKYLPETIGAGCAFLDYDNDGWMDIYLVNSGKCDFYDPLLPFETRYITTTATEHSPTSRRRPAWLAGGFGMGVAVGDYDGDGWPDLYVTQYGRSILYHNNGDGTFTDVTAKAGVAAPRLGFERGVV